ncbi:TPA: signal peptidase II [Candidatus Acetothermia bacterium]|nr:signal peptidase II [Candidatus Acetothermia bacterium]
MRTWPYIVLGGGVLGLDRLAKALVFGGLAPGESLPLLGGVLKLTRVHNLGGAFGLLPQHRTVFLVVSGGIALGLTLFLVLGLLPGRWLRLGGALLGAGAWGNLIDRLSWGYVLDFIQLPGFPVFNVADLAIVVGAGLLALGLLWRGNGTAFRGA